MRRAVLGIALLLLAGSAQARAAGAARTVVFFASWSALIDQPAQSAIADIAAKAKAQPALHIALTGYASTVGGVPANTLLAELRAQVVRDQLAADGVPDDHIEMRAVGPTTFRLDPIESRRVEIALGEN